MWSLITAAKKVILPIVCLSVCYSLHIITTDWIFKMFKTLWNFLIFSCNKRFHSLDSSRGSGTESNDKSRNSTQELAKMEPLALFITHHFIKDLNSPNYSNDEAEHLGNIWLGEVCKCLNLPQPSIHPRSDFHKHFT